MKYLSLVASILASAAAVVHAQGPIQPASCTYTATPCEPFNGPVETITVYEQPFAVTSTRTFDCHGCTAVTVSSRNCDGPGIPIQTTTFEFLNARSTTTVNVCSPTPGS